MQNQASIEPFLQQSHSLLAYAAAHRATIKLRDQKQLDFEELSAYLSAIVSERDRLAALNSGHAGGPVGLGTYLRDQVDKLRGTDDIHTRRERMRKLDGKIKEVSFCVELCVVGRVVPKTDGRRCGGMLRTTCPCRVKRVAVSRHGRVTVV